MPDGNWDWTDWWRQNRWPWEARRPWRWPLPETAPIEISKGRGAEWRAAPPRKVTPRIGQPGYWSAMGIPALDRPAKPTPVAAPTTDKNGMFFERNVQGSGQDGWVTYMDGQMIDFKPIQAGVQSLPVQAQWQLQELARTRKALGVEANPFWAGLEQSIQERLGTGDITPEDLAMIERARKSEIASKFQEIGADIPEWGVSGAQSVMAERLRAQARWRQDQRRLLAGLPSGPEGDVARWFVQNQPDPYRMLGRVGTEPSASETGRQPAGPPAPSWLPEFVPGTTAGEPIGGWQFPYGRRPWETEELTPTGTGTMPFVPTPSGQQLTRMKPSQVAWLQGAIGHYGGRSWGDILAEAEVMQPQTPRGAGQRRWRPPTQRVAV